MTTLTFRHPFLATPFRLMDKVTRSWSGTRVTGFTPLIDVRETNDESSCSSTFRA